MIVGEALTIGGILILAPVYVPLSGSAVIAKASAHCFVQEWHCLKLPSGCLVEERADRFVLLINKLIYTGMAAMTTIDAVEQFRSTRSI